MYLFTIHSLKLSSVTQQYTKVWQQLKTNKLCASKLKIILILVTFLLISLIMYGVIFSLSFNTLLYLLVNISIEKCK